jgi:hypothetical protein
MSLQDVLPYPRSIADMSFQHFWLAYRYADTHRRPQDQPDRRTVALALRAGPSWEIALLPGFVFFLPNGLQSANCAGWQARRFGLQQSRQSLAKAAGRYAFQIQPARRATEVSNKEHLFPRYIRNGDCLSNSASAAINKWLKQHIHKTLAACQKGLSVGFTTAAALVHEMMEARDERRLVCLQKQMTNYKLLIIDELGFVPLSKTGAERLFELISKR